VALATLFVLLQGCQGHSSKYDLNLDCGLPATAIQDVQGGGAQSPLVGSQVVVEAVLTHRLSSATGGKGVYIQDAVNDPANPASGGLVIYCAMLQDSAGLATRRLLRVVGTVAETDQQTRVVASEIADCGHQPLPAPRVLTAIPPKQGKLEDFEGMRVTIQTPLTVNDLYSLGFAGRILVSSGGREYAPTEIARPGEDAQKVAAGNRARTLTVVTPIETIVADSLPRGGDQLATASGILGEWRGAYQLHLDHWPDFVKKNPRETAPERTDALRISSFNVLNFFNGDGQGSGFPTPRGASSPLELQRQQDKIVAAMSAIDADLFALAELENDGYDEHSAVNQLKSALNTATQRSYEVVSAPDGQLGESQIAVGLLYDPAVLTPRGPAITRLGPPFDQRHRPPLIQTFDHQASGRSLTVVALHLKSKRCNNPSGADVNRGDGQGCWNHARTEATRFLANWLIHEPPAGVDPDSILLLGDFNAHTLEDPLRVLTESGLVNLMGDSKPHHSFVFAGQSGSLDHGFASQSLASLARTSVWHINADEAIWLDYNLESRTPELDARLYRPDAYRSSDHDPLIIDLTMH
jgi:predicted extracellular nuclease